MPTLMEDLLATARIIGAGNVYESLRYPYYKAWTEARWETTPPRRGLDRWYAFRRKLRDAPQPWPREWQTLGTIETHTVTARGLEVQTAHGSIEVLCLAPDLVRARYRCNDAPAALEPLPYAIARPPEDWPPVAFTVLETTSALLLCTTELVVGVQRESGLLFFAQPDGQLLRVDASAGWCTRGALCHTTTLSPGERLFGLGERATPGNRRGRSHRLWNTDPAGYAPGDDPIDLNIPVYLSLAPGEQGAAARSYLVFYENPYDAEFDLGGRSRALAHHRFEGGELRYYFAAGPAPRLLERYTELTGRHDLPPLWSLGYQQCRWSYTPEARVRQLAQDFREHDVPCDALYLDIDYMDGFRVFTWNRDTFDLPRLAGDLREQGFKIVTIIDPGVKVDPRYAVYRSGLAGGHFCTLPNGQPVHAPVWPGPSAFPDFSDPAARAWWGEQYRPLIEAGIAGFWNDMNEPAAFAQRGDHTLPSVTRHALEGRGGDHREAHNLYGLLMARASREGLLALRPETRPIVITRAGWAGVQRHAISWTGDNQSTWESLRLTIPLVTGLGLSGVGFTGPDVGGFAGEATGELFTRWIQQAAFMPLFRAHTATGTPDQEPWSYGEPYLSINRRFIQLRYELLPYLYTAIWQMTTRGWPVVRPLWWDAPAARALWDVEDAFLCGDALLVAPVGEPGATARDVTLPPGAWYDFWTNRVRQGEEPFEQYAPLEIVPLFVRAGAVLPLGEIGPCVEQRPDKFLRLEVYLPVEDGETVSWLYEDAGEGFAYRAGEQRVSRFVLQRAGEQLTLTWEREGDYTPPYEHIALTLHGVKRTPQSLCADGETYPLLVTDPVRHTALFPAPPFARVEITL